MPPNSTPAPRRQEAARAKRSARPMKPIFKGKSFSFSGDFGSAWAYDKVARWITLHGGTYTVDVTSETTHLICTLESFKKKPARVRRAQALGKSCKIVVQDWLEDCLVPEVGKPKRCRAERGYECRQVVRRGLKTLAEQRQYRAMFEDGVKQAYEFVDNKLNHIYVDPTGLEYKVICTRINTAGRVKSEKWTMFLFESNARPHHYHFAAKLNTNSKLVRYRQDCIPSQFEEAFFKFRRFFRDKTGIDWDDRFELEGKLEVPDKFRYCAPEWDKPVGILPPGKERKEPRYGPVRENVSQDGSEKSGESQSETDLDESRDYYGPRRATDTGSEDDEDDEDNEGSEDVVVIWSDDEVASVKEVSPALDTIFNTAVIVESESPASSVEPEIIDLVAEGSENEGSPVDVDADARTIISISSDSTVF